MPIVHEKHRQLPERRVGGLALLTVLGGLGKGVFTGGDIVQLPGSISGHQLSPTSMTALVPGGLFIGLDRLSKVIHAVVQLTLE
jgi:hypothetical protein